MFDEELSRLERDALTRRIRTIRSHDGVHAEIDGRSALIFCSNDYLGLAAHPALRQAAREALERYCFGSGASRLVSGASPLHQELEEKTARFKNVEAALLFNSGYAANTGVIPALASAGDLIVSDSLNHASIIDGCRMSRARTMVYRHRDLNQVEDMLKNADARRKLIVTDGVFSMDGDLAPLPGLVELAERHGAWIMVDDAHGTGVLGSRGTGTVEHFGLNGRVHIQVGTYSKALGSFGAYVAGTVSLIRYLVNNARSFMFSTALPPAVCAASLASIGLVESQPELRQRLWDNRNRLAGRLRETGLDGAHSETPIIPIHVGASSDAVSVAERLLDHGIYAAAIRPPTVPEGTARIRVTVSAAHSTENIDALAVGLARSFDNS